MLTLMMITSPVRLTNYYALLIYDDTLLCKPVTNDEKLLLQKLVFFLTVEYQTIIYLFTAMFGYCDTHETKVGTTNNY